MNTFPLLMVNISPLRVARGQSVANVTDIPLMRDNLGNVFVSSTSIKGAIRSAISEYEDYADVKIIFGTEKDEKNIKAHVGLVSFHDAYLIFIPVSSSIGTIYVSSPYRLNKFFSFLGIKINDRLDIVDPNKILMNINIQKINLAGGITLIAERNNIARSVESILEKALGNMASRIKEILYGTSENQVFIIGIVDDPIFDIIVNKALVIRPGIRIKGFDLDDGFWYNKVVTEQGPRFEEEVPRLSIFISRVSMVREKVPLDKIVNVKNDSNAQNGKTKVFGRLASVCDRIIIENENGKKYLSISPDCVKKYIETFANSLFIGGKETLTRGLVRIIIPRGIAKSVNIDININHKEKIFVRKEYDINTLIDVLLDLFDIRKTSNDRYLINLKERIETANKELKGKFSNLPEKFRVLDTWSVLYFYSKMKEKAEGEGYGEVRKTIRWIIKNTGLSDEIIDEDGHIKENKILEYLRHIDFLIRLYTELKYVIRAHLR